MNNLYLLIATIIIVTSCTSNPANMDDFTYTYSMENTNNFKIEFQLNSDSTFKITQYNFFFDNFEQVKKPIYNEGTLSSDEFSTITKLLQKSNIENMEDSYGFNDNTASYSDIIYMIELNRNGKSNYVSINSSGTNSFPEEFTKLIEYTNKIISMSQKEK